MGALPHKECALSSLSVSCCPRSPYGDTILIERLGAARHCFHVAYDSLWRPIEETLEVSDGAMSRVVSMHCAGTRCSGLSGV